MQYIKLYEDFRNLGMDLDEPEGFKIIYNHPQVKEIMRFLEKNLGTKDNPMIMFTSDEYPDSRYYGWSKDKIMFRHRDYQDEKNSEFWVRYDGFWSVFEVKFHLNYTDIKEVMSWYIGVCYNLKASDTLEVVSTIITGMLQFDNLKSSDTLESNAFAVNLNWGMLQFESK